MKSYLIFAIFICLAACNSAQKCTLNPELVRCSDISKPVCGIKYCDGKQIKETYANECIACALGKVDFTVDGCCEEYPCEAHFCNPWQPQRVLCSYIFNPQCGYLENEEKHHKPACPVNYPNTCIACSHKEVLYVLKGFCPRH